MRACEVLLDGAWVPGRLVSWTRDGAGRWAGFVLVGGGDEEREVCVGAASLRPAPAAPQPPAAPARAGAPTTPRPPPETVAPAGCSCPPDSAELVVDLSDGPRRAVAVPEGRGGPVSGLLLARCTRCGRPHTGAWRLAGP